MNQEFKMDTRLAQDIAKSMGMKKPEFEGVTWDDFMTHIRASLGVTGFSVLDQSREPELLAKINELETERDKKAEEYKELLKPIQEAIDSKLPE